MDTAALIRHAQSLPGLPADRYVVDVTSLDQLLSQRVRESPDRPFLAYFDDDAGIEQRFTYARFGALVERIAAWLAGEFDIGRGDCVATFAHNHPLGAATLFACWRLGAIAAPQNLHEDDARVAFILKDSRAKALLYLPEFEARAKAICASAGLARTAPLADPGSCESRPIADDDLREAPALLVYTSGTTGNPKGVMLSQYNLIANAKGTAEWHRLDAGTRMMCVLPIHHVNGILVTLITPLVAGASVVLNKAFKTGTFWQRIAAEHVAMVSVVPTILQFLCEAAADTRRLDLSAFRYVICGAGTLAIALVERFEKQFGIPIIHGYGLSETTAFVCTLPIDLPAAEHHAWLATHGYPSIGAPFPYTEMAIHDPEGNALPESEHGEIVARGHFVMQGYLNRPDANAETFKHGWFRSGDEGFFKRDAQGRPFFFITGRLKELINRGGVKYSPFEIEEVLLEIPGVKVGLAIAFDNEWYGEEVGAYVVREADAAVTEEDVLAHCRSRMPFDKCPKVVVFGTEIPVTVTGKYQRLKLKPLFAAHAKVQFRR
jgi:long-chain acyl-CoA synthetase